MFQRIFRHTKHEAYHADHEDEAFPESREVREVGGERECLHFQIERDFRNKFFQTRFTIKMEYWMVIFGEKIIRIGLSLYLKVIAAWYRGFLDFTLPVNTLIMT